MIGNQRNIKGDKLEAMMAGVGLGYTMQKLLGLSVMYGLNQGLETLVSQAWGAGNRELCGVYLNRGRFLLTLIFIPFTISILHVKQILIALGQHSLSAQYT